MTVDKGPDPVRPTVHFDSYVIPETVKEERVWTKPPRPPRPDHIPPRTQLKAPLVVTPMALSLGVIFVLTFMLGVLSTLYLASPRQALVIPTPLPAFDETMAQAGDQPYDQPEVALTAEPTPQPTGAAALAGLVSASLEQGVTRQDSADLITPTGAMSQPGVSELSMTEILLGLSPTPAKPSKEQQAILNRNKLRILREGVLSGKYTVRTVKRNGKERLCLRLPNAKVSQDEAADMIRLAAERGEIELPESLSTADGDFDADTLIFNLVQTSLANDGTEEGARAAQEMSRRAFAASKARTTKVKGERVYVVEPGDSLAYISLQFYGRPSDYDKIFQANRALLSSPDRIQIGQRLIIPG